MQGSIAFDGTLSGSIAGGGGGGSEVTITPILTSGTKIADYEIDSTPGELYAPTPESLSAQSPLSITSGVISIDLSGYQEKLTAGSYITIDSDNEISCSPPISVVWYTPEPDVQQGVLIGKFRVNDVIQNVYAPSWDYSTSEFDTGKKWIDGKSIYCRTLQINNFDINLTYGELKYGSFNITDYINGVDLIFGVIDKSYILASGDQRGIVSIQPEYPAVLILNNRVITNVTLVVTLEYTKA